jgi:hypothetical protein
MKAYTLEYTDDGGNPVSVRFCASGAKEAYAQATRLARGVSATLGDDFGPLCRLERNTKREIWRVHPIL